MLPAGLGLLAAQMRLASTTVGCAGAEELCCYRSPTKHREGVADEEGQRCTRLITDSTEVVTLVCQCSEPCWMCAGCALKSICDRSPRPNPKCPVGPQAAAPDARWSLCAASATPMLFFNPAATHDRTLPPLVVSARARAALRRRDNWVRAASDHARGGAGCSPKSHLCTPQRCVIQVLLFYLEVGALGSGTNELLSDANRTPLTINTGCPRPERTPSSRDTRPTATSPSCLAGRGLTFCGFT